MSGRIGEIHRRLRGDNVPCVLEYRPGLGTVLLAGIDRDHPTGRSAVLLHEAGGRYWIRQGGRTFAIPAGADEQTVVDSVKLRVVHAWAQVGDPDAAAVLARVRRMVPAERPGPAALPDPFALAFEMFGTAMRIGWSMTVPGPWGVFRTSFEVR